MRRNDALDHAHYCACRIGYSCSYSYPMDFMVVIGGVDNVVDHIIIVVIVNIWPYILLYLLYGDNTF